MDPHPLSNLFKRSNYDEHIASEFCALDYLYEVLLEIRESKNCDEVFYEVIHDISLNKGTIAFLPLVGSYPRVLPLLFELAQFCPYFFHRGPSNAL